MEANVAATVALAFGFAGMVISVVALLQTRKANKISGQALVQTQEANKLSEQAVSQTEKANELSELALFHTQQAKTADHEARLIDRAASRLQAFEGISGSNDMALIQQYKTDHSKEFGGYYAHFRQNSPHDIEVARSRLAKFWKVTIQLYERNALPKDFFDRGQWLRWGDRYRQLVEPLDVARYYRDGFFKDNQVEYDKAGNRPKQHRFMQTQWETIRREDEVVIDGMVWCVEIEKELRRARSLETLPV